jgi:thiol-disulfide isomerase/thioredoxin
MKKIIIFIISLLPVMCGFTQNSGIPSVEIKNLDNKVVNSSVINNAGKPIILDFWATWCKPCIKELTAIAENYETWQKETGVKVVAVSIDDSRTMSKVAPFVNVKDWEFEFYLDPNSDFKRAMNVSEAPHTFIIDGKGNVVWQHKGYIEGDEAILYELLKKVAKGEQINN